MQEASSLRGNWQRNAVFFLIALLVVAADQLSKNLWIRTFKENTTIFGDGFFHIVHTNNTGAAFGLFQGQTFALTIVAIVGTAVLLVYALFAYRRFPFLDNGLNRVAIVLILGGTVGNLIDRLRLGYVTDFIGIGIWPAFNVADSSVVVGVIIFVISLLPLARAGKQKDG